MSNAAEKISDLFNISLAELETNIIASAVKFNTQPQRLLDELQQSVIDFKTRFYEQLHSLLQFVINNEKDVQKIAQQVESHVTKFKQQQLLVQMKLVLNSKLKQLLETFGLENQQKFEVQTQIKQLKESLLKIETTLMEQQQLKSPSQQYITPYPKKNFITASDRLTPNLSDEAEMRGKGFFITPENRQQQPRQFEHSHQQYSSNESYSVTQNKTLNSFDKEKSEDKTDLQSPFFGFQQQHPTIFQNEAMNVYLQGIPQESQLLEQSSEQTNDHEPQKTQWSNLQLQHTFQHLDSLQTTRTEQIETNVRVSTPKEQSQHQARNQSVEPNIREVSQSPNNKRLIQTSNSKEPFSRCRPNMETVNLLQKLNSVEVASKKSLTKHSKSKSNKENQAQPVVKCSKPSKPQVTVQKAKATTVIKVPSQQTLVKKQKSN